MCHPNEKKQYLVAQFKTLQNILCPNQQTEILRISAGAKAF